MQATQYLCILFRMLRSSLQLLSGCRSFYVNVLCILERNGANVELIIKFVSVDSEETVSKSFFRWYYSLYAKSHRDQHVGELNCTYTLIINYMISCQPNTHLN